MGTDLTRDATEARSRADNIRARLEILADNLEMMPDLVAEAYQAGDWISLGYETWEVYVCAEYGTSLLRLAVAVRQDWVRRLSAAGLSKREIAPVVNVGTATVGRDRDAVSNDTDDVPAGTFRIMPKIRMRQDGGRIVIDLQEYRQAVRDLASIWPEPFRTEVIARYEGCLTGIHLALRWHGEINPEAFAVVADEVVGHATADIAAALTDET